MQVVRLFYADICACLMSSISIASDAYCDGLPSASNYELTRLGFDSISGLVLKSPSIQSASTIGEGNPKEQEGESTGRQQDTLPHRNPKPREQLSLFLECHDTVLGPRHGSWSVLRPPSLKAALCSIVVLHPVLFADVLQVLHGVLSGCLVVTRDLPQEST